MTLLEQATKQDPEKLNEWVRSLSESELEQLAEEIIAIITPLVSVYKIVKYPHSYKQLVKSVICIMEEIEKIKND